MKYLHIFIMVIFVFTCTLFASDLRFGGYLQNRTTLTLADEEIISDIAQARLEGTWNYGQWGGIETHVLVSGALRPLDPFETVRSGSVMDRALQELLAPLLTEAIQILKEQFPDSDATGNQQLLTDEVFESIIRYLPYSTFFPSDKTVLDRALIKAYFSPFDLFIGRQMIAWGTGYAFNPTDIWNQKSPLDPEAPRLGVNALRAEIPLGMLSGVSLVVSPGRDFAHSSGGIRVKTNVAGYDMSISGMRIMNADRALLGLPGKFMAGVDLAGEIGNIGIWAEAAFNNPVYEEMEYKDLDSSYFQVDLGFDYTFNNGVYTILEYYFNGLGQDTKEDYNSRDLIHLLTGEMAGFAKHYLFGGVSYTFSNQFDFSAFVLGNLVDHSAMLLPSIKYLVSDNITIETGAQIGIGDKNLSEFGGLFPNFLLTAKGYF
ncbi:hypothetical protein QA601_15745 [Chitinispirillales bacterium ANBcel5]|uniref:hypothetical protein n=1 Tax=Cellulosispirillum alkaliphilum TaxID=3039283 RepID=UPI002A4EB0DA|nr:hypothetical protein [Chitinispirillales bacterium ANBcel5]